MRLRTGHNVAMAPHPTAADSPRPIADPTSGKDALAGFDRASGLGAYEDELRRRGLPLLVTPTRRMRGLVFGSAPLLLVVGLLYDYYVLLSTVFEQVASTGGLDLTGPDQVPDETAMMLGGLLLGGVVLVALAPLLFWWLVRVRRRAQVGAGRARSGRTGVGRRAGVGPAGVEWMVSVLAAITLLVVPTLIDPGSWWHLLIESVVIVVVLLAASYLGIGVLVSWSLRRTLLELGAVGAMVVRVLPMLLLVILFLFFNTEIWQIASPLPWHKVWLTAGIMAALAMALTVVTTSDVLVDSQLRSTLKDSDPEPRRGEVVNVTAVPALVMVIQAVIFGAVVFVFLVGFGLLSVPVETVRQWLGHSPRIMAPWLHLEGLSGELLKVSLLLGAFSSLNFVASMGTDSRHRAVFMGSILDELAEGLELREPYLRKVQGPSRQGDPSHESEHSATTASSSGAQPAATSMVEDQPPGDGAGRCRAADARCCRTAVAGRSGAPGARCCPGCEPPSDKHGA